MKTICYKQGFTLLEMLLVVVIVGIMATVGVNVINSQSIERNIMDHAKAFEQNLKFLCEKAVFENQALGLAVLPVGYTPFRYQRQQWQAITMAEKINVDADLQVELLIDGITQRLADEKTNFPQIVCQADGSFNAFELRFTAAGMNADDYYAIRTTSPWELTAQWHTD